ALQSRGQSSLGVTYLERDGENPSKFVLIVLGTEDEDQIAISGVSGGVRVRIDSDEAPVVDRTFTESISRIEVYAQGGHNRIKIASDVTSPALVFGGNAGDVVHAGGGPTVLWGRAGRYGLLGG